MEHNPNRYFQCHLYFQAISSGGKGLLPPVGPCPPLNIAQTFSVDRWMLLVNELVCGIFSPPRAQSHKAISTMPKSVLPLQSQVRCSVSTLYHPRALPWPWHGRERSTSAWYSCR